MYIVQKRRRATIRDRFGQICNAPAQKLLLLIKILTLLMELETLIA